MHIPRSPRAEGHIAAANHQHKSSLRDTGSPNAHKDLKVRFAQADEVKEFESGPAAATTNSPSTKPDVDSVPNSYYGLSGGMGMHQSASPSCSGTAPQLQPDPPIAGQPPPQQYPAAPYGYYYNPYAYAQYSQMGGQGWPPQQGTEQQAGAPGHPQPPAAALNHDAKRMQMMARSVSITVNPPQQDGSSMQVPGGVLFGSTIQPPPGPHMPQAPKMTVETEEEKETRLFKWARRRLRWSTLHRVFKAWTHVCRDRWWKTQIGLRDQQAQLLAAQVRHVEFRPVRYIRRYKMKLWFKAWIVYTLRKRNKHLAMQRAEAHAMRVVVSRAFAGWISAAEERCKEEAAERRAQAVYARRKQRSIIKAWKESVGNRARKEALLKEVEQIRSRRLMKNALGSWAYLARYYRSEKISTTEYTHSLLSIAFSSWKERVSVKKQQMSLVQNFHLKHAASLRQWAFYVWLGFAEGKRARSAHEFHSQLSYEVERLRQENERLARVVDSGDWGRDRVAELTQAGQVLQQERDALVKLVESLPGNRPRRGSRLSTVQNNNEGSAPAVGGASSRRGSLAPLSAEKPSRNLQPFITTLNSRRSSSAINPATIVQAESQTASVAVAAAKAAAQMKKIPQDGPKPASLPANLRAKMTVRAGSSFNALVRALKQDLLTSGALAREPDAAFAVDKISAQRVEVTAGGGITIEAVGNTASPGFSFAKSGLAPKPQQSDTAVKTISSTTLNKLAGKLGGRSVGVGKRFGEESLAEVSPIAVEQETTVVASDVYIR